MARFQSGSLNVRLEGISTPTATSDAANKSYVDNQISNLQDVNYIDPRDIASTFPSGALTTGDTTKKTGHPILSNNNDTTSGWGWLGPNQFEADGTPNPGNGQSIYNAVDPTQWSDIFRVASWSALGFANTGSRISDTAFGVLETAAISNAPIHLVAYADDANWAIWQLNANSIARDSGASVVAMYIGTIGEDPDLVSYQGVPSTTLQWYLGITSAGAASAITTAVLDGDMVRSTRGWTRVEGSALEYSGTRSATNRFLTISSTGTLELASESTDDSAGIQTWASNGTYAVDDIIYYEPNDKLYIMKQAKAAASTIAPPLDPIVYHEISPLDIALADSRYQPIVPYTRAPLSTLPTTGILGTVASISRPSTELVRTTSNINATAQRWGFYDTIDFGAFPPTSERFNALSSTTAWEDFFSGTLSHLALNFGTNVGTAVRDDIFNGNVGGTSVELMAYVNATTWAIWNIHGLYGAEGNMLYLGGAKPQLIGAEGVPGVKAIRWYLNLNTSGTIVPISQQISGDGYVLTSDNRWSKITPDQFPDGFQDAYPVPSRFHDAITISGNAPTSAYASLTAFINNTDSVVWGVRSTNGAPSGSETVTTTVPTAWSSFFEAGDNVVWKTATTTQRDTLTARYNVATARYITAYRDVDNWAIWEITDESGQPAGNNPIAPLDIGSGGLYSIDYTGSANFELIASQGTPASNIEWIFDVDSSGNVETIQRGQPLGELYMTVNSQDEIVFRQLEIGNDKLLPNSVTHENLVNDSVYPGTLNIQNNPTAGDSLRYNATNQNFIWTDPGETVPDAPHNALIIPLPTNADKLIGTSPSSTLSTPTAFQTSGSTWGYRSESNSATLGASEDITGASAVSPFSWSDLFGTAPTGHIVLNAPSSTSATRWYNHYNSASTRHIACFVDDNNWAIWEVTGVGAVLGQGTGTYSLVLYSYRSASVTYELLASEGSPPSAASTNVTWVFDVTSSSTQATLYGVANEGRYYLTNNGSSTGAVWRTLSVDGSTLADNSIDGDKLLSSSVDEVKLNIHNNPSNGQFLVYTTTNGMEWQTRTSDLPAVPRDQPARPVPTGALNIAGSSVKTGTELAAADGWSITNGNPTPTYTTTLPANWSGWFTPNTNSFPAFNVPDANVTTLVTYFNNDDITRYVYAWIDSANWALWSISTDDNTTSAILTDSGFTFLSNANTYTLVNSEGNASRTSNVQWVFGVNSSGASVDITDYAEQGDYYLTTSGSSEAWQRSEFSTINANPTTDGSTRASYAQLESVSINDTMYEILRPSDLALEVRGDDLVLGKMLEVPSEAAQARTLYLYVQVPSSSTAYSSAFRITLAGVDNGFANQTFTIPAGTYSRTQLVSAIRTAINNNSNFTAFLYNNYAEGPIFVSYGTAGAVDTSNDSFSDERIFAADATPGHGTEFSTTVEAVSSIPILPDKDSLVNMIESSQDVQSVLRTQTRIVTGVVVNASLLGHTGVYTKVYQRDTSGTTTSIDYWAGNQTSAVNARTNLANAITVSGATRLARKTITRSGGLVTQTSVGA